MAKVDFNQSIISNASIRLLRGDVATELLSGREVITSFPKARWALSFNVITLTPENRGQALAAVTRLSNLKNFFEIVPPNYSGAAFTGAITVAGGAQIGTELNIAAAADTLVLKAGEWFTVNGELKFVIEDCATNGSGLATVQFEPPLRNAPANATALETQAPVGKYRLVNPEAAWAIAQGGFTAVQFDCIEVIND